MNNLKEFRNRKLMTQKELAERSGMSQVTISFIENSLSSPMDLTKQKLARALKCAPLQLFPGEDAIESVNNLRETRIEKLMTQKDLSEKSGVSQVTISFLENDLVENPMNLTKQKLARALRCTPLQLFPDGSQSQKKKIREIV